MPLLKKNFRLTDYSSSLISEKSTEYHLSAAKNVWCSCKKPKLAIATAIVETPSGHKLQKIFQSKNMPMTPFPKLASDMPKYSTNKKLQLRNCFQLRKLATWDGKYEPIRTSPNAPVKPTSETK